MSETSRKTKLDVYCLTHRVVMSLLALMLAPVFICVGILLCLSFIGMLFGIPMIVLALGAPVAALQTKYGGACPRCRKYQQWVRGTGCVCKACKTPLLLDKRNKTIEVA